MFHHPKRSWGSCAVVHVPLELTSLRSSHVLLHSPPLLADFECLSLRQLLAETSTLYVCGATGAAQGLHWRLMCSVFDSEDRVRQRRSEVEPVTLFSRPPKVNVGDLLRPGAPLGPVSGLARERIKRKIRDYALSPRLSLRRNRR